ncbi:MAG: hypothetical protein ABSC56_03885 [Solirubrobacteraceae bacterium]|jgi:hypothetical protein
MASDRGEDDRDATPGSGVHRTRSKRGSRALKLALLGGAVAVVLRDDLRNQLLDVLFGAEEEFDYTSLTEPPVPSGPPREPSEPFVRSASGEAEPAPPVAPSEQPTTAEGEPAGSDVEPAEPLNGARFTSSAGEHEPEGVGPEGSPSDSTGDEPHGFVPGLPRTEDASVEGGEEPALPPRGLSSIAPSPAAWRAAAVEQSERAESRDVEAGAASSDTGPPPPPAGWWSPSKPGV